MDAAFFQTLQRQAFEERSLSLQPGEHRLLSFFQALYACAPNREGGTKKYPNKQRKEAIPYELDAAYWLYALNAPHSVSRFVALGNVITQKMPPQHQESMLRFISNLDTENLRDSEVLEMLAVRQGA